MTTENRENIKKAKHGRLGLIEPVCGRVDTCLTFYWKVQATVHAFLHLPKQNSTFEYENGDIVNLETSVDQLIRRLPWNL
jgi:hypothetical protein